MTKLDITIQNKGGRPSKKKQVELNKILVSHFNKYHSAAYTSEVTGINRHTVNSYFNEYCETQIEETTRDFVNKQKNAKDKALAALDRRIEDFELQLADVGKRIKLVEKSEAGNQGDDTILSPEWSKLQFLRLNINQNLAKIVDQKATLEITPTIDISLENIEGQFAKSDEGVKSTV